MVKKIILYFITLLFVSSCIKNEICYTPRDYEIHIIPSSSYEYKLSNDFIYWWSDGDWGDIGYKDQNIYYEDIYVNDCFITSKLAHENPINVLSSDIIDCVVSTYNLQESDHTYILTTPRKNEKVFSFLSQYPIYDQPDEIWSNSIKNIKFDINKYKWDLNDELYSSNIHSKLNPQSFIYVIQIIIHNDKNNIPWGPVDCDSLVLSGVSCARNIMTQKSINDKCNIIGEIKPRQDMFDKMVFCSRIVTFGLPSPYQDGSSWDISQTIECFVGFKLTLLNGVNRRVKVNISNRMKEIPFGGLINIELNYSEIYTDNENEGGMNVGVGDWGHDEINIYI